MKIPIGMQNGQDNPIAQKIQEAFPDFYIGATLFMGDLSIHIKKEGIVPIGKLLHDDPTLDFDYPVHISSVDDWGNKNIEKGEGRFEVVYELFSIKKKHQVRVKARVSETACTIDSVTEIWKGANYQEREVYDMMGITFNNHPDLKRILLPDEYDEGYPLRKNFPVEGRGWRDTFEFLDPKTDEDKS
ncbi:MAG: NADH-quinone oxidoreductase subunit C [Nitrospirota bacterium]